MTEPDGPLVVHLAYPGIDQLVDLDQLARVSPRIEMIQCTYQDSTDLRTAKRLRPFDKELRASEPPLDADQRAAFARAEVLLGLDAPFDLGAVAPRLRWIQAMGSGVGQFAASHLGEAGVILTNAVGVGAPSIAEFTVGRVLELYKNFPKLAELQERQDWIPQFGRLLRGSTVAVVGLGAIGQAVADRLKPFGVQVLAIRRSWQPGMTAPNVDELFGPSALHEVLARSDVVVLAAAGTPETAGMIDQAAIGAMKPGAIFVNVARGNMVDENALIEALASGHLAGAAIDVAREEPLPAGNRLWDAPNLLISPHSSTSQDRYFEMIFELFVDNMSRYVAGQPLRNLVDLTSGY
jgi:phosphoglycerate dehydrogenase-like enzyme